MSMQNNTALRLAVTFGESVIVGFVYCYQYAIRYKEMKVDDKSASVGIQLQKIVSWLLRASV